jgi:hypothetical protein
MTYKYYYLIYLVSRIPNQIGIRHPVSGINIVGTTNIQPEEVFYEAF